MSRAGLTNILMNSDSRERNLNIDSTQTSMFEIWENQDDSHETTYQLISPDGDVIDLTFTTNDPRAFDNWCIEEGLNPDKIHAIAREGLNSAYKEWFVKIIDNPVVIPEPVVEEKPKKKRRKRRTKAQIEADKLKAVKEKPKPKRKAKKKTASKPIVVSVEDIIDKEIKTNEDKSNAEYLAEKDTSGWHRVPRALEVEASVWQDAEEIPTPINRKQRRAAKKRSKRKG